MTKKIDNPLLPADDVEDMIEMNQDAMQSAMQSYNEWLSSACQVQTEILGFISNRVREDLEMPKRMAECTCPADVVERQMAFTQKMFADYADESMKLMGLISEAKADSSQRPQS